MITDFIKEANNCLKEWVNNPDLIDGIGYHIFDNGFKLELYDGVNTALITNSIMLSSFNIKTTPFKLNDVVIIFDSILIFQDTGHTKLINDIGIDLTMLPDDYREWDEDILLYLKLKLEKR